MKPREPASSLVQRARRARGRSWLLPAALLALLPGARGTTLDLTWLGGTGNWNSLGWGLLVFPSTGDRVTIGSGLLGPGVVTLNVNASVSQLTINSGASLTVPSGTSFTLTGASTINGTLALNGGELHFTGSPLLLSGSGVLTLSNNAANVISGTSGSDVLRNQITIQGAGTIGSNARGQTTLINDGFIIANQTLPLAVQAGSHGSTNTGTMRATNGATLSLLNGSFDNTGGSIEAEKSSTVEINQATITAGTITTTGTGALRLLDATITGSTVTNSASGVITAVSGTNTLYGTYADSAGSQARIANGATMVFPGGAGGAVLNGGLYLDSTGTATTLSIGTAGLAVTGSGSIVLSNNANNRIIGTGNATLSFGSALTVTGAGQLGAGTLGLSNAGLVRANASSGLVVDPGTHGFTNTGTLQAANNATLTLQNGTFTGSGPLAKIEALTGSTVSFSAATVTGSTLTTSGTGRIQIAGATALENITLFTGATLQLLEASTTTLRGTFTNNGMIFLNSGSANTDLVIGAAALTLDGTGTIVLNNSQNNQIYASTAGNVLTLGANQTLSGAGQLGAGSLGLVNRGTIAATETNPLVINVTGASFTNHGTLKASGTGGLTLSDASVVNRGNVEVAAGSAIRAAGAYTQSDNTLASTTVAGTFSATSFSLQSGSLLGTGTVSGPVTSNGSIYPGGISSVGTLTFNDSLTLGPGSTLFFNLGGPVAGTGYDRINGTSIALNGTLSLTFANGFESTLHGTETLTLISASTALSGQFTSLADGQRLGTVDGLGSFQINYLSNSLTLSNFQALSIPEPSTNALLGLGAGVVLALEWRRRRRTSASSPRS